MPDNIGPPILSADICLQILVSVSKSDIRRYLHQTQQNVNQDLPSGKNKL